MAFPNNPTSPPVLELNAHAINSSCVGFWPLTHVQGTTATDISTGGNDGTESGGVTWASTDLGNAASFDGTDDRFDLTSIGSMDFSSSDFTVSMWIYVDSVTAPEYLWTKQTSGNSPSCIFWFYNSTTLQLIHSASTTGCTTDYTIASSLVGGWNHLVASVSSPSSLLASNHSIYLNGSLLTPNASINGSGTITESSGTLSLAGRISDTARQISADMQNVRVWNTALSASDVTLLYNRPWVGTDYDETFPYSPPVPSGMSLSTDTAATSLNLNCVGWWPLTEGTGTVATDISTGGNNGTISGTTSWVNESIGTTLQVDGLTGRSDASVSISDYPVTLAGWFKTPSSAASNEVIFGVADSTVGDNQLRVYTKTTGVLELNALAGVANGTATGTSTVDDNKWHFGVGVFESSTSRKLYVDGVLESTDTAAVSINACDRVTIGVTADSTPAAYFGGEIQNVRVWDRALTADEITLLYERPWDGESTYGDLDPYDPPATLALKAGEAINTGCVGWWPLLEEDDYASGAADISGNANNGTQTGGVLSAYSPLGGVASFDGVDDGVTGTVTLTGQDLTISFWALWDDYGTSTVEFAFGGFKTNMEVHFGGIGVNGVRFIPYQYDSGTPSNYGTLDCASMVQSGWNHYTFTAEKSGYSKGYLNGVLFATSTTTGAAAASLPLSQDFNIGVRDETPWYYYDGSLQNIRLWSRALSAVEVQSLYETPWIGSNYPTVAEIFNYIYRSKRFRRL